jgi:two-component system, OmpR family, phosphate regulon sensor histidine kinase PhoR
MSNRTLRIIFILAVVATVLALVTQYLWIRKAYTYAELDFNRKVTYALHDVGQNIMRSNYPNYVASADMVKQITDEYYIVKVGDKISYVSLKELLKRELKAQKLETDFEFGAYDCESEKMKYGERVYMDSNNAKQNIKATEFPKLKDENYYFGVNFPNREKFLNGELFYMNLSSIVLGSLLILLAYIVFVIFRQRKLQEIQKDFVSNMTHEFKTPLSTIQIAAEVLKNPKIVNSPERLLNYATMIGLETSHLTGQVERVLQMASNEKGKNILNKSEFIINDVINEIIVKYRPFVRSKEGDISLEADGESISIKADRLHIKNVMSNLIDNALKYCDKEPQINICVNSKGKKLEISVQDNGIGIKKEHINNIFDKFYRVPTGDVHNVKGFGIGLSYIKSIIKNHNGEIKCHSNFGVGTKFTIFIPKY